jgi:chaperonin cofactor prefoldin
MRKKVKKNKENNLATKRDLDILGEKLKIEFRKDLIDFRSYLEYRIERGQDNFNTFKKDFAEFKNRIYNSLDSLTGSYKKFDEEHAVISERYSEIFDKLEDLETRVLVLESKNS